MVRILIEFLNDIKREPYIVTVSRVPCQGEGLYGDGLVFRVISIDQKINPETDDPVAIVRVR